MSSDDPSNVPATRDRREAVREKAAQVQVKQARAHRLRLTLLGIGAVAVVGVLVVGVVWAFQSTLGAPQLQPAKNADDGFTVTSVTGADDDAGSVIEGDEGSAAMQAQEETTPAPTVTTGAPVDVRVYVDYLSEGSAQFQIANASQLREWVDTDAVELTYYPVAMLTAKSNGTKYSLRAASAAACVATYDPDAFFTFNDNLLRSQPEQGEAGATDEDLTALAQASGVTSPKRVGACIEGEKFVSWARDATDRALAGIADTDDVTLTGTPLILVNGEPYVGSLEDPDEFAQFVMTVSSDTYYATPTPTPTASTTPSS